MRSAFAALKARLPANALAVCSPARRTRETAERLGLVPVEQAAFREQDFWLPGPDGVTSRSNAN